MEFGILALGAVTEGFSVLKPFEKESDVIGVWQC